MAVAQNARAMTPSSMLLRLQRETQTFQDGADEDRLQLLAVATPERYASFLSRIWGFEAPLEAAFAKAPGLVAIIDLRGRTQMRLLRQDLAALGMRTPSSLPACRTIPCLQAMEALGWLYAVEHNALLHRQLRRHLQKRLPTQLAVACSYLAGGERSMTSRREELGLALDRTATTGDVARIIDGARVAFQRQRQWFRTTTSGPEDRAHPVACVRQAAVTRDPHVE